MAGRRYSWTEDPISLGIFRVWFLQTGKRDQSKGQEIDGGEYEGFDTLSRECLNSEFFVG
jgi:hypothetical protein